MADPASVTGLLVASGKGDDEAFQRLVPLVERELHRIAKRCMAGERVGHSLQATALVNEAYLRLIDIQQIKWQDRAHFLAMSARLMRRILVDWARSKQPPERPTSPPIPSSLTTPLDWRAARCRSSEDTPPSGHKYPLSVRAETRTPVRASMGRGTARRSFA